MSRLALFADVKSIADSALAAGGGQYTLPSHGEAVHWRQRFYSFRKAYAKAFGANPYDQLILRRIDKDSSTVTIDFRRPTGVFTSGVPEKNDFDRLAEELSLKLGKEPLL